MSFAAVLLDRAKWFHKHAPDAPRLPDRFASKDEAVRAFIQAQLFEAHQSFAQPMGAQHKPLSTVDLGNASPGIIERDSQGSHVRRASAEVTRPTCYDREPPGAQPRVASKRVPPRRVELALTRADDAVQAKTRRVAETALTRATKRAARVTAKRAKHTPPAAGDTEVGEVSTRAGVSRQTAPGCEPPASDEGAAVDEAAHLGEGEGEGEGEDEGEGEGEGEGEDTATGEAVCGKAARGGSEGGEPGGGESEGGSGGGGEA